MQTNLNDVSGQDILERILDGCIAFDTTARFLLFMTDFTRGRSRVVVAPERRRNPFRIPPHSVPAR